MIHATDVILRIAVGLGLGAAIGLERQWRSRNAGLRTAALVSLGATLFVLMGGYSFVGNHDADPLGSPPRWPPASASSVPASS